MMDVSFGGSQSFGARDVGHQSGRWISLDLKVEEHAKGALQGLTRYLGFFCSKQPICYRSSLRRDWIG